MRQLTYIFILCLVLAVSGYAGTLGSPCPGPVAPPCNDVISSLGTFMVSIDPFFQAAMTGNPGYDPVSKLFVSPTLFDPITNIGRSTVYTDGGGEPPTITVGSSPSILAGQPSVTPAGFPTGNNEIRTAVLGLNMTGSGFAVRAGTNAPGRPDSIGAVQAKQASPDFPAYSFFDIFVEVDLPGGMTLANFPVGDAICGTIPGGQSIAVTCGPLVVKNDNLTDPPGLPPQIVYIHGSSSAVDVVFTAGPYTGLRFGSLKMAGHGAGFEQDKRHEFQLILFNAVANDPGMSEQEKNFVASEFGIPEPSTWTMMIGAAALLGLRRRFRKS